MSKHYMSLSTCNKQKASQFLSPESGPTVARLCYQSLTAVESSCILNLLELTCWIRRRMPTAYIGMVKGFPCLHKWVYYSILLSITFIDQHNSQCGTYISDECFEEQLYNSGRICLHQLTLFIILKKYIGMLLHSVASACTVLWYCTTRRTHTTPLICHSLREAFPVITVNYIDPTI